MNLGKKRALVARTFSVGKERIVFVKARLEEIKEAITKQDIKELHKEGAIIIKDVKGRKRNTQRKPGRSSGNIRKKVNKSKKEYMALTRKLRRHVSELKKLNGLSREEVKEIRKKIRNKFFKSKSNLKEHLNTLKK